VSAFASWRYRDASLLGVTVAVIMALNLLWVSRDTRPPYWDYARHLADSIVYQGSLSHPLWAITTYQGYPPFAYWVTDVFYWVFGTALWVAILSNVVFLSILVYATPLFVSFFKEYMLDAPLSAMVALALYFLIRSENFAVRRYSLLFGLACGLGMMTKWAFAICIALPAVVAGVAALVPSVSRRSTYRLVNVAAAGAIAFAICGVWYIHNWSSLREDTFGASTRAGELTGQPVVGSLPSVLWYFWNLLDNQLYLIPFAFFVVGLVFVFLRDESARKNSLPIFTIVSTYVGYTLVWNKEFRYTMPMLPAVAVVATHWLEYVRPRVRNWLSGGLVVYGALAFLVISFGTSLLSKDIRIHLKVRPYTANIVQYLPPESPRATGITIFAQHGFAIGAPRRERWYVDTVFKDIAAQGHDKPFWFQEDADSIWFNRDDVRYYTFKYHLPWVPSPDMLLVMCRFSPAECARKYPQPGTAEMADFLVIRQTGVPSVPSGFVEMKQYPLPDGGTLWLYGRA
jgi:4-amino-4-deoxy-L-arabinose transferase-like glycosyltransferase